MKEAKHELHTNVHHKCTMLGYGYGWRQAKQLSSHGNTLMRMGRLIRKSYAIWLYNILGVALGWCSVSPSCFWSLFLYNESLFFCTKVYSWNATVLEPPNCACPTAFPSPLQSSNWNPCLQRRSKTFALAIEGIISNLPLRYSKRLSPNVYVPSTNTSLISSSRPVK